MRIMVNKKLFKLITTITLVIFIIMSLQNILYAANTPTVIDELEDSDQMQEEMDNSFSAIGGAVDGLVGVLTFVFRVPLILIGMAGQAIFTAIASLGGSTIQGGLLTPDDLFYNRVGLTNINFFDFSQGGAITVIRTNVATWYYILRIFAIIILLVVLIYIGIRMAISTVASEQAQYKRMLTDWVVSFALIFFLGYIILFTLEANNAFLEMLETTVNYKIGSGVTTELIWASIWGGATSTWAAVIVYLMLMGMTATFLFAYIKRMLTIGFLIIISPLITITYSIDRVKDGKAQALNTWLREFMLTVLIQPFHCIIYTVFVSASLELMHTNHSIASMVLSIMCMGFIWQAEKIVKEIFGFNAAKTSLGDTVASALIVKNIGDQLKSTAGKAGKAVSRTSFGRNLSNRVNSNPTISNIRNTINSNPRLNQAVQGAEKILRKGTAASMGIGAAAVEKGMGTSANAAQVGFEAYKVTDALLGARATAVGSREGIRLSQNDLERCARMVAINNPATRDFTTNPTSRDNLKSDCESLIGANMRHLEDNIQMALRNLMAASPTEYNLSTAQGVANLQRLQDAALDPNTDLTDPTTNPNYDATTHPNWTAEEAGVINTIQRRNLAEAVNSAVNNYHAAGYSNPTDEMRNFIDTLT